METLLNILNVYSINEKEFLLLCDKDKLFIYQVKKGTEMSIAFFTTFSLKIKNNTLMTFNGKYKDYRKFPMNNTVVKPVKNKTLYLQYII